MGDTATEQAAAAVQKTGHDLQTIARKKCPVRTGYLRSSIQLESQNDGLTCIVGPEANYAAWVEYGTPSAKAQPFVRPATDEVAPGFLAAMKQIGQGTITTATRPHG